MIHYRGAYVVRRASLNPTTLSSMEEDLSSFLSVADRG
jgi:hypothetical protein